MGTIYQRRNGGAYYGYWTDQRGRARRKSLRTRDQKVARERLRVLELGATDSAAHSHHTLDQAVANLLAAAATNRAIATGKFYAVKSGHLMRILGRDTQLADLTRDRLLLYVRQRKVETASASTIHKELMTLRRALAEAKERKLWAGAIGDLVPSIKQHYEPKQSWLDEHQARAMLARIAAPRRLWFMLAVWGGLCRGEVDRLDWRDVDLKTRVLLVRGTKRSSRFRSVPIAAMLHAALTAAQGDRRAGLVAGKWGNVIRALNRAAELVPLPAHLRKLSPNDLRRTFASIMLNAGASTLVVSKLLGHASTKMVELVYGQISAATMRSAIAMLPLSDSGACAAGERNQVAIVRTGETDDESCFGTCSGYSFESLEKLVPRDGVEPPTRGFSDRKFVSLSRKLKPS